MSSALVVRMNPCGPLRAGSDSGARDRVDLIFHSDSLYSAVCQAMGSLGQLDPWLEATAGAGEPAVAFTSCFPFHGDTLFVPPPRTLWPPPASAKVRWKGARLIPAALVDSILAGEPLDDDRWMVDGESECLVPAGQPGPVRVSLRSPAAVDRLGQAVAPHLTACLEFSRGAGLWTVALFADETARDRWAGAVEGAFRLLADTGLGGERSSGWGRFDQPEFTSADWPACLLPGLVAAEPSASAEDSHWLLSLVTPAAADLIRWEHGNYSLLSRSGRVESMHGHGSLKKTQRMIAEGSVLIASGPLRGSATDVRPDGFPHAVYRAGFAVSVPIRAQVTG